MDTLKKIMLLHGCLEAQCKYHAEQNPNDPAMQAHCAAILKLIEAESLKAAAAIKA